MTVQRSMFFLGVLAGFVVTSFDVFPFLVGFSLGMGCYEINPEAVVKTRDYALRRLSEGMQACTSWARKKSKTAAAATTGVDDSGTGSDVDQGGGKSSKHI